MATAAAVSKRTTFLHERGAWNTRDDRTATVVWLGIFWAGVLAGFGVDLRRYLHENPVAPLIVHVHAVVFTIWLLLVTAQVTMVVRDRVAWHRSFGWFAAAWTGVMVVVGPWAAMSSLAVNLHTPGFTTQFLSVMIVDLAACFIFVGWGLASRKNPAAHRRLMMLAMVAIADPGFARLSSYLVHEPHSLLPWFVYIFYGNLGMLLLMTLWDWRQGRLMRQFAWGSAGLAIAYFVASALYFWGPWKALTYRWVEAWARMMG